MYNVINYEKTYLWQYREAIRNGEILAGQEMIMELDNLIHDWDNPEYIYDIRDAYIRIDFIENCVKLTKSPFYGKPFILLLWQKALIEVAYSFKMKSIDTGEWVDRFQEILLIISRKCGKTELIAALELCELILGEAGSNIICSGTNDAIADLCYQSVDTMRLLIDPKSIDTWRNQKGIKCFYNNNFLSKLSDSSRNKEGRNIDMAGIDEIWALLDDGIYKPIQQSTSTKDNYKIFMFGSEGFVVDGFLDKEIAKYRKIINREDDSESAKRKLPWIYSMDSEAEVWETNEKGINPAWEKANPSIGAVKKWSYLRDRVDEARRSKSDRMFVLSKDFNFKVSNAEAWLMEEDLNYTSVFDLEDFRGRLCLGAVDLAETTDMCSAKILLMKPDDKTKYVYSMYWIPESKLENADDFTAGAKYQEWARKGLIRIHEGNEVDISQVADWFAELYSEYKIRTYMCGFDQRFSKEFLKRMDDYGFDTEMVQQNRYAMSTPMRLVEAEIKDQLVNFNNNEIDKWCMKNTSVQMWDTGHMMPVKIKGKASHRIDGAVSLIILYEILRRYRTEFMASVR
ncbi:terminase TerL endonuclease subunit [Massilicoli timonensis]|uniref:terminase TerL endonuclease subunit n=1 Tax=Massilicoli timonensis TaxID=2015901 RepID=UPI003AB0AFA6